MDGKNKMKQGELRRRSAGFTLMELIVVIVILGVLMTTVSVGYMMWVDKARVRKVETDYESVKQAADLYKLEKGKYPDNTETLTKDGYVNVGKDPWGNAYDWGFRSGKIFFKSFGADGSEGGGDDVDPSAKTDVQ